MPHLSEYERETIIHWNEESKRAEVYTCSEPIMRRCERLGFKKMDEEHFSRRGWRRSAIQDF